METKRRITNQVKVGKVLMGGGAPVAVQSMLNTPTMDTEACVEQAVRIIEAGGELVRVTAPGVREAENLRDIRRELRARGYAAPLCADIHFTPEAALVAAREVEKVRINPGNFVDKRATFHRLEYTEEEYAAELEVLRRKFTEFLEVCREHGTAVRIGTNHGSLSDRIMSRYGDTPEGMVEATMEYLRVARDTGFRDVVISLKSSDCRVMVQAVRLLVREMEREGMAYPLHLGVTEAGEGEDGRIRSAVGIGTLLNEGIGDTIRVSLTEAPEAEIPVARMLVEECRGGDYRECRGTLQGECSHPVLVGDLSGVEVWDEGVSAGMGFRQAETEDPVTGRRLVGGRKAPEFVYTEALGPELSKLPEETGVIVPLALLDMAHVYNRKAAPLCSVEEYVAGGCGAGVPEGVPVYVELGKCEQLDEKLLDKIRGDERVVLVFAFGPEYAGGVDYRYYFAAYRRLQDAGVKVRTLVRVVLEGEDRERLCLKAAAHAGGLFLDRVPDGLWVTMRGGQEPGYPLELARNILQSAGVRRYKAEFISCPGCGRTRFDLQGAVARVKEAFAGCDTLKIAVMGCVVNGPGEMGDADFGYVGAGNGKVNLYRGRERVRTAVPEGEAIGELRKLIEGN